MSSRQIKWLRQQLEAKKPKKQENLDDIDPVNQTNETPDLSVLINEDSGEIPEVPQMVVTAAPPPPPPPKKNKKTKRNSYDEELEFASLLEASQKVAEEKAAHENKFSMQKLNLVRELKTIIKTNHFDDCLKLPKSSASIRFMSKLKKWPNNIPQFFNFVSDSNNNYKVEYTEYGEQQSSIYRALARLNDAEGIMQLGQSAHFSPPVLPILCQSLLFQREFESATEIALRGLYILQQSLPSNFVPMKSKLLVSPARKDFLDLIAFVARFAFRRCCFETSLSLWKFGISLTDDDPANFLLLAAVPALYAEDREWVEEMINSEITWREVPIRYIPDWSITLALMKLPDDIESLSNEMSKWPFIFEDLGLTNDIEVTPFLSSLGSAFRRRITKYLEKPELDSLLETCAIVAQDIDMSEEQAMALSFWYGVSGDDVEIGDMVEEFVMPTG
ncbi:hypothetical protein TRFO_12671 [Tritrichomonas foetus]|uniref:Uncharacterized protein n=1 Tax=Tritrichomonas foetus TaxID=1144522 RepID=A0A1J4L5C7_9EUKA|nr:hypothetical protein TRFO_12671 [Tritrichomonas foetus]|eukprot:OHT17142.1 hypothetical protein TRFO_12671 [Tritrichomonas foetus]